MATGDPRTPALGGALDEKPAPRFARLCHEVRMRMTALGAFLLLAQFPYLDAVPPPVTPAVWIPAASSTESPVYELLDPPEAPRPDAPEFAVIEVG
jgi:hypothetical protein